MNTTVGREKLNMENMYLPNVEETERDESAIINGSGEIIGDNTSAYDSKMSVQDNLNKHIS